MIFQEKSQGTTHQKKCHSCSIFNTISVKTMHVIVASIYNHFFNRYFSLQGSLFLILFLNDILGFNSVSNKLSEE